MSVRPFSIHFCVLTVLLITSIAPAAADPIRLTTGEIGYSRGNDALIRITAPLKIDGSFGFDGSDFGIRPDHGCFSCQPGTSIDLSQGESSAHLTFFALLTINNNTYELDTMDFHIDAGSVKIPLSVPSLVDGGPFLFRGSMSGSALSNDGLPGPRRTFDFVGTGKVGVFFSPLGDTTAPTWFSTSYTFGPSPVPEPATCLLLGTALVFGLARHRTRARPQT